MQTVKIPCTGYEVVADVYGDGKTGDFLILSLIGRTSNRSKQQYSRLFNRLDKDLGAISVVFDYSGHGESPFNIDDMTQAQHFSEVVAVFDWMQKQYPNRITIVIGSSYGGAHATRLMQYRDFNGILLRAPAIYIPDTFYTKKKDENRQRTDAYRKNKELLAKNPLLIEAAKFKGQRLLIVHGADEIIPTQVTDAYADALNPEVEIISGLPHSLDDATPEQMDSYLDSMYSFFYYYVPM